MKELYIEGVAIHDGPESCAAVREGVGEALTGVRAGRVIEPRNPRSGVPTLLNEAEGHIAGGVIASRWRTLRGQRPGHARNLHAREPGGPRSPVSRMPRPGWFAGWRSAVAGREGNAEAVSPR